MAVYLSFVRKSSVTTFFFHFFVLFRPRQGRLKILGGGQHGVNPRMGLGGAEPPAKIFPIWPKNGLFSGHFRYIFSKTGVTWISMYHHGRGPTPPAPPFVRSLAEIKLSSDRPRSNETRKSNLGLDQAKLLKPSFYYILWSLKNIYWLQLEKIKKGRINCFVITNHDCVFVICHKINTFD